MKRLTIGVALLTAAAVAAPVLRADVKTKEKTLVNIEGVLGGFVRFFGGSAMKDGITSTVAVKGNRKAQISDISGQIVDLTEQKVYLLDMKKKEYTVQTFAELRAAFEKARAEAAKQKAEMKPEDKQQVEDASKQFEFDAKVEETGQKKNVAGYDAREVVVTVTGHEKGKTVEGAGGFVMTNTMWIGPKIAAIDERRDFEVRFVRAVYGESLLVEMQQQMAQLSVMYPSFGKMLERSQTESKKMNGTTLSTSSVFEVVRSEEQLKQAQQQSQSSGGGGIGGMIGRRVAGNRGQPQARTKVMTTTVDLLSVETTVTAQDVAMPAGFKEKK